jgi:DNA polymerase-3 subunit delta'
VGDPFTGVVGHDQALGQLRAQLQGGRLAHAYLFVGEAGLGKSTAARALAAALLPEAQLHRHPDYWEDDRIKPLSINEIRLLPDKPPEFHELSLQAFLNLKPAVGSRRVAVVANVGRLRDQDQSVLLKTLEEPHPHRVIILTTPSLNPFVVLPTVVSRCRRVFFHPVPAPEIERLLREKDVAPDRARLLADLARGRPGWAVRVAGDDGVIEQHRDWTRRLEEVFGAPADVPLNVAEELDAAQMAWRRAEGEAEDPAVFALASWQVELRRRMLATSGREQGRWARLVELSYDTLGYLEQNVSPRLALETFLLEVRREGTPRDLVSRRVEPKEGVARGGAHQVDA